MRVWAHGLALCGLSVSLSLAHIGCHSTGAPGILDSYGKSADAQRQVCQAVDRAFESANLQRMDGKKVLVKSGGTIMTNLSMREISQLGSGPGFQE